MLDPSMDVEADLGIDSIKRVEILGAMQTRFPMLPKADPEALSEMRTLGQITQQLASNLPLSDSASQIPPQVASHSHVSLAPIAITVPMAVTSDILSQKEIASALLGVVSEKTGYPVEMLEPGMDMEADLGIDSIKRVEILGAMQSLFPALPRIEPEALSELRTLGQIIEHLGMGSQPASPLPATARPAAEAQPLAAESQVELIMSVQDDLPSSEAIGKSFLQVVSEKTGYPVEMLDLSMDMEADLGIDSIKRVEILGAMQAQIPSLPKVDPETLAELRTLGQVAEHLAGGMETARPF